MKKNLFTFVILTLTLLACSIATSYTSKETLGPYYTWDADMINVDTLHQQGYTGKGVYVAVLDTGLAPNWRDYFPEERIAAHLGKGFKEPVHFDPKTKEYVYAGFVHETTFIGSTGSEHGTHVTSTIIGYNYYSPADAAAGLPLPPIYVQGITPEVTIIPVKVLSDYHFGSKNLPPGEEMHVVFGTDLAVAAGIRYATNLKIAGYSPMIITMSLGGPEPALVIEDAINYAISNGVIVVAAAGNEGDQGMAWPGAYPQVISVGACGWKYEWYWGGYTAPPPRNRLWWLQSPYYAYNDVAESSSLVNEVYITEWSSREKPGQDLDVVAPGSWVRGPYAGDPGYSHLPWWSNGYPAFFYSRNPGNFYYVGGTSMATPHVTGVVALMLQKNPSLTQSLVENILETTALAILPSSMTVWDLYPTQGWYTYSWGSDATGKGLVQADAAVAAA
ncbi:MAG: S8 family serine peptidase [Candidatus Bathyarchaeota archaeon]|nr:S8 family serine peptidase [Candidatus Bathyarchaeota archaeon]